MTTPTLRLLLQELQLPPRQVPLAPLRAVQRDVVHHWCALPDTPYSDLGRPTLKLPGEARGYTLDFTLQHQATGQVFVSEMKSWLK